MKALRGKVVLNGDKSISHRAIILSALASNVTRIKNISISEDCSSTINVFRKLGVKINNKNKVISIFGKGIFGLKAPKGPIYVGDSGTTMRIMAGVLAGQDFVSTLTAGKSLSLRPMKRVLEPLRLMGANINAQRTTYGARREEYPPLKIKGTQLSAITYKMPLASAQVKSAVLLAGLYANGITRVIEPIKTRDHTERMLELFKAKVKVEDKTISIENSNLKSPAEIFVPGDISSASFFIVGATVIPNSHLTIKSVSLNPTRTGVIKVLNRMGAKINVKCQNPNDKYAEPIGDLVVKSSKLKGTVIKKEEVPSLIDELPILMVAAACARGMSIFEAVEELRVKESDRISAMLDNLKKMGADVRVVKDGKSENIVIKGGRPLKGAKVASFGDHRIAMSMSIVSLVASGKVRIDDMSCIKKSFPDFLSILRKILR